MFSFFGKVATIAVDTVTLPLAIAVDVATLGGALTGRDEPFTVSQVKNIGEDAESLITPDHEVG